MFLLLKKANGAIPINVKFSIALTTAGLNMRRSKEEGFLQRKQSDSGSRNWGLLRIGLQQICPVAFAHVQPCLGALGVQSSPWGGCVRCSFWFLPPPPPPIGSLLSPLVQPHLWGDSIV
uniref:Uncharacterized protein n=1 Tax=Micrurus corallinus TaxID=54390 RepID=A0A2D4FJ37_MICCO